VLKQPVDKKDPDGPTFWIARTETASRVRGRIENVLDWAYASKPREGENPARWKGLLDQLLPAPVENHPALPYRDLPAFMAELRGRDGVGARALEFTILCAARSEDTRGGKWTEIDEAEWTWTVPAARLKGRRGRRKYDHVVPLSDRAIRTLQDLPREEEYIFAGGSDEGSLSNNGMASVIDRMNDDRVAAGRPKWIDPRLQREVVPHGFRSRFKDWCGDETHYPNEMSEMALAHTVSDKRWSNHVHGYYWLRGKGNQLSQRRRAVVRWAGGHDGLHPNW